MKTDSYDSIIIGGGFFGLAISAELAARGERVLLLEKEGDFLTKASYNNQARIHNGYHYPRHFLTAIRSRVNFPRFTRDYEGCVVSSFEKYYAIGSRFSKTTASQFRRFMERAGLPIVDAPSHVRSLFSSDLIEAVFATKEYAFDAVRLKEIALARAKEAAVELVTNCEALFVRPSASGLDLFYDHERSRGSVRARRIYNATYSNINRLLSGSRLPMINLKHEITEMCLVDLPGELRDKGITVMCGPFFSVMPFPPRKLWTLTHVRYTPHCYWYDRGDEFESPYVRLAAYKKLTSFPHMVRDASRYLPCLSKCAYADSLWEVKTTLPASESDDGRPILFKSDVGLPGLTCVMGGKIDNVYDVFEALSGESGSFGN